LLYERLSFHTGGFIENQNREQSLKTPFFANEKVFVDASFADIVPWFLENRKEDVKKVREFLIVLDFEKIQRMGHRWKGTCASYGFQKLSEAGELFESLVEKKQSEEIHNLLDQTEIYLNKLEVVYVPALENGELSESFI